MSIIEIIDRLLYLAHYRRHRLFEMQELHGDVSVIKVPISSPVEPDWKFPECRNEVVRLIGQLKAEARRTNIEVHSECLSIDFDEVNPDRQFQRWEQYLEDLRIQCVDLYANKTPHVKRRRRTTKNVRPLTPKQTEVMETVSHHAGNRTKAASELGITRQAVDKAFNAGMKKLGPRVEPPKPRIQRYPHATRK